MKRFRIALAQINTTVGDIAGNTAKILEQIAAAKAAAADMVVFPELAVTGYPPEDLLYKPGFIARNQQALEAIAAQTRGIVAVVGFVERQEDIYNAAAVIEEGAIVGVYRKHHLPNYGVFDEERYFQRGHETLLLELDGYKVGVAVCEDLWFPEGPLHHAAILGAEAVVVLNASPFSAGKVQARREMLLTRARDSRCAIAYVNQVGGQDELVFDGRSMVIDAQGRVLAKAAPFAEQLLLCDLDMEEIFRLQLKDARLKTLRSRTGGAAATTLKLARRLPKRPLMPREAVSFVQGPENVYNALKLGLKDYIRKNGFDTVVLGLSGGVDSALVATIAADALGADKVVGVLMPSPYSSSGSIDDSVALAENIGIRTLNIPIEPMMKSYGAALEPHFAGRATDATEENLQARIRGMLLMALSNKFGWIVVATGNKSEMSVGYATLYGDMVGGFALIKDVLKTTVYELCRWRNEQGRAIPENILTKAPSAELRPGQTDQDELPAYEVLDQIIRCYIEDDLSIDEIDALGIDPAATRKVVRLINQNEYKRHQAPVGIKITERAFGRDRRMPITHRFKE
ncbi:MAG: NAD+ synthase [Campylobacterales bacterium]